MVPTPEMILNLTPAVVPTLESVPTPEAVLIPPEVGPTKESVPTPEVVLIPPEVGPTRESVPTPVVVPPPVTVLTPGPTPEAVLTLVPTAEVTLKVPSALVEVPQTSGREADLATALVSLNNFVYASHLSAPSPLPPTSVLFLLIFLLFLLLARSAARFILVTLESHSR